MIRTIIALFLLSGCASESRPVIGPDGKDNWRAITCRRNQSNCYKRAGEECPGGYEIADQSGHESAVASFNRDGGYVVPVYRGEMLVRCKQSQ